MRASCRGVLAAGVGLVLACTRGEKSTLAGPRLTVRWTGADTAAFSAPATAARCEALHLTEIRAVSGDTGVGLALYDSGSIQPGTYRIRTPTASDTSGPAASLALRWFSKTAVQGFQGDSGEVVLRRAGADALSGTFRGKANPITGAGRLEITGSFDGVRLGRSTRACVPPAADTAKTSADSADLEVLD